MARAPSDTKRTPPAAKPDVPPSPRPASPFRLRDHEVERALRTGEQSGVMEDLFGAAGLQELSRLAREAEAVGVRGGDRVLILPGIMGSKLGYADSGDEIWVDPFDIAAGRLKELRLDGPTPIHALGVLQTAYLALKLRLRIRGHDAEFFPFDWRLSLAELGRSLAADITAHERRTHLVCHSMGGLVARATLAKPPKNLGRIITIGTPHNGSYAPVQAVRGVYSIIRKIAALDFWHSTAELAAIFGAFPGLLHMIPAPTVGMPDLFDLKNWPKTGSAPDAALLGAARKAQADLPPLPPGGQAVLIVGVGVETVIGARLPQGSDEFTYDLSNEGDGTVPLDLALAPGLPTYVTGAGHGQMPNDNDIARAVDNIIATGTTAVLDKFDPAAPQRRATPRGVSDTRLRSMSDTQIRSMSDTQLAALGPARGATPGPVGMRQHRELLSEVAAPPPQSPTPTAAPPGSSPTAGLPDRLAEAPMSRSFVIGRRQHQMLEITLARGSITDVEADAYVLGVFRGVAPAGATRAVDAALGNGDTGPLTDLIARRMVSGGVGEITSLPVGGYRRMRTDTVMLAGLGDIGRYQDTVLEAVGESVMRAALLSRLEDFAIVPIGASVGAGTSMAISLLVTGLMKALHGARGSRLRGFTVCETDEARYAEIRETFYRLLRTTMFDGIEVAFTELDLPQVVRGAPSSLAPSGPDPVYLLVQQELDGNNKASAVGTVLTAGGKAAIVKRSLLLNPQKLQDHLDLVQGGAQAIGDATAYGQALSRMVLDPELLDVLARECAPAGGNPAHPLVVVHDAPMSRVPWELLQLPGPEPVAPALLGGLSHRFNGGTLSTAKWAQDRVEDATLQILLVVDPTENLAGARAEGDRIAALIKERMPGADVRELRGPEARKRELMDCFSSGAYDVVHYAGHAFFDPANRSRSGILCYGNVVLSGADLASLPQLPSLVVFNACESARVRRAIVAEEVVQTKDADPVSGTVSFAEAFLSGGVANYLGTYWPVGDAAAAVFAETFYGLLLKGRPIGEALLQGRRAVRDAPGGGADWADYVFYGDPRFLLKAPQRNPASAGG